ncbi:Hypothetical protein NTJ_00384 [Nesidiocoris tenuis]|uniref:Uncharacterized protein n=1 Tax=Nesidiocoris tenuis TaxID=355587 RepID=A0ABN7A609_9HEMI|nr:Hypothetical protein NTJ_00384 [Nesidiocoris tenuis]
MASLLKVYASMWWIVFLFATEWTEPVKGQISETIPMNLRDCYNSSYIVVRENLLPMTMTTLIALLRKLETSTYNMNNRIFAPALLYQYRYDGIVRNPDVQTTQYVKPYSRSGKEYYLYKLQMNRIIPTTSSATINDDSLTLIEKCTLHAMLSLSIDKYDRGDGDVPCSRLSKYSDWNSRYPRDLSKAAEAEYIWPNYNNGYAADYQFAAGTYTTATSKCPMENGVVYNKYGSITPGIAIAGIAAGLNYQTVPYNSYFVQPRTAQRRKVQSGIDHYRNLMSTNRQQFGGYGNPQSPGNVGWPGSANGQSGSGYRPNGPGAYGQDTYGSNNGQLNGYGNAYPSNSQGNGYGGGSGYGGNGNQGGNGYGGNGYQGGSGQQGVNGYGSNPQGSGVNFGGNGYNQNGNVDVDSRYAATLSGIVALESLLQGPEYQITIGSKGAWNSSSLPKYYFLQDWFDGNVLTDARIAGGVDGLYMGTNIQSWTGTAGDMKLSQILDAYYSNKGVLASGVKACARRNNFGQFSNQLVQQTYATAYMLNNDLPPTVIIEPNGVSDFSQYAAQTTATYISSLPGTLCSDNTTTPYAQPYADITVVVDCSWQYRYIAGIFNYLAEECDFWKYGSNLTIISAKDGFVLADSIQSPLDIPQDYNQTVASGFDFPKVLSQLKVRFLNKLQNAVYTQSAGGIPHIVIFVPMTNTMTDNDKSNALDTLKYFKFNIPDVKFLYLVPGSKEAWTPFAENKDKDVIVASTSSSDMSITLQPLINRIKQIPRRIINPNCGRYFDGGANSQVSLDGYLSPNEIHYYRIHQNYFFKETNAVVTISKAQINGPTLTVCKSRDTPHPTQNTTNSGSGNVFCTQITSSGNSFSFKVNDECSGDYYAAECRPIYFSVFNPQYPYGSSPASCRDAACRFPDQSKYTISHYGLTCYSTASLTTVSSLIFAIIGMIFIFN